MGANLKKERIYRFLEWVKNKRFRNEKFRERERERERDTCWVYRVVGLRENYGVGLANLSGVNVVVVPNVLKYVKVKEGGLGVW